MGKPDARCWYKVIVDYELPLVHILRAHNLQEIDDCFMQQMFDYQVIQLSWLHLSKLTGCIIPSSMVPAAVAKGDLMFKREGELFMLTSVNELGE